MNSKRSDVSDWYVTPNSRRKRKRIQICLSDVAICQLYALARAGERSATVERLIGSEYVRQSSDD